MAELQAWQRFADAAGQILGSCDLGQGLEFGDELVDGDGRADRDEELRGLQLALVGNRTGPDEAIDGAQGNDEALGLADDFEESANAGVERSEGFAERVVVVVRQVAHAFVESEGGQCAGQPQ